MSKEKSRRTDQTGRRVERRAAQLADLRQRATAEPPAPRREHIKAVDVELNEHKYEELLLAIESGLVEVFDERDGLPVDDEAERALRIVIARFEGDSDRRSGSADVDAMADRISRNIDLYFRRHALLSRAEIIGCLRRIITSIGTWHTAENPRAYFDFAGEFVRRANPALKRHEGPTRTPSSLWVPGQKRPLDEDDAEEAAPAPRRPGGLWLPGDR